MGKGTDVGAQIPGLGESLGGCLWPLFKVFMSVYGVTIFVAGG